MSQSNNSTNLKAGQISVEAKRGRVKFFAYNLQRGKPVHVGTKSGNVYEKVQPIFRQRQSFNLTRTEYAAILEAGASFINIVLPDKTAMYSIGVERFARYAQPYDHPDYGGQLACPLKYFSPSSEVSPRNARRDNPPVEMPRDIIQERLDRQPSLFGWTK
jgi:hypothetical protein